MNRALLTGTRMRQGTTSGRVSLSLSFFFTLWANVLITGYA